MLGKGRRLSPSVIGRLKSDWRTTIGAGKPAICRPGAMFMSGRTASICGAHGAAGRMHVGSDWRDAGGGGASGVADGHAGSGQSWKELLVDLKARGLSTRRTLRSATARSASGGPGGSVSLDAPPAVLAAQEFERSRQLPSRFSPTPIGICANLAVREPRGRRAAMTIFAENMRPIRQGGRLPAQGSRCAVDVLRFPRGHWTHLRVDPIEAPSQRFGIARFA